MGSSISLKGWLLVTVPLRPFPFPKDGHDFLFQIKIHGAFEADRVFVLFSAGLFCLFPQGPAFFSVGLQ